MVSDNNRALFSKAWWAEITKRDDFWKEFEKNVAKSTVERRFRSAVGTKDVTLFTKFRTRQKRTPRQAKATLAVKAESDGEDEEDASVELEREETGTPAMDVEPSIEVVNPPVSGYDLLSPPRTLSTPAPDVRISMRTPPLARKRKREELKTEDEVEDGGLPTILDALRSRGRVRAEGAVKTRAYGKADDNGLHAEMLHANATTDRERGVNAKEHDKDTTTSRASIYTPNPLFNTSPPASALATFLESSPTPEITFLRSTPAPLSSISAGPSSYPGIKSEPSTNPPPKKLIKLEEDSAEYLEFQKFRALREGLLRDEDGDVEGQGQGQRVKVEGMGA
jgi:hypothetical protein